MKFPIDSKPSLTPTSLLSRRRSGSRRGSDNTESLASPPTPDPNEHRTFPISRPPLPASVADTSRLPTRDSIVSSLQKRHNDVSELQMRPRAWTGPSLPPFSTPLSTGNKLSRFASQDAQIMEAELTPRDQVVGALDQYLSAATSSIEMDDTGAGGTSYIVSGKGLKTTSSSKTTRTEPSWQRGSTPPAPALSRANSRRASSPALAVMAIEDIDDIDDEHLTPRRASVDSSFGRSAEDITPASTVKRQRLSFYQSSSVGSMSALSTVESKKRLTDEGVRASLRSLANLSSSKAAKIPATIASTGNLIKDKAIKHIKSPSGGKYEGEVEDILDVPPKEIARQLTLLDSEAFRNIPRDELASIAWTGPDKCTRAPQIVATTQHFNQVALWVSDQIVSATTIKRRFQLVCHFIGVAKWCLYMHNFNGLKSISAGLQSTPVYRLERTWAMVGRREKALFDKMCDLMSPLSNSETYRKRLIECKPPCVPYLGIWLSDLTFLYECLKKEKDDPNRAQQAAERLAQIDTLLDEIDQYQANSIYTLEPIPSVQEAIMSFQLDADIRKIEEDQYKRSCTVEPKRRETNESGKTLVVSSEVSSKAGTIKSIRNRMRGNSGSIKLEPVDRGQLELDVGLGPRASQSDEMVAGASLDEKGNTGSAGSTWRRSGQRMLNKSSESESERGSDTVATNPSSTGSISQNPDTSTGIPAGSSSVSGVRLRRARAGTASMPLSQSGRARKGHRRSKSGSAVTGYGRRDPPIDVKVLSPRLSAGSISDFLVSRNWEDLNEEATEKDERDLGASAGMGSWDSSDKYTGASDDLAEEDNAFYTRLGPVQGSGGSIGNRDSVGTAGSRRSETERVYSGQTTPDKFYTQSPLNSIRDVKDHTITADVTYLPDDGGNDSDDRDDDGRISPVDIDTITNQLASRPNLPLAITLTPASPKLRRNPKIANVGPVQHQDLLLEDAAPTTVLNTISLEHLSQSSQVEPLLQGMLVKKDELLESGNKVPGRKWIQVWAELYQNPCRLELFAHEKDVEKDGNKDNASQCKGGPTTRSVIPITTQHVEGAVKQKNAVGESSIDSSRRSSENKRDRLPTPLTARREGDAPTIDPKNGSLTKDGRQVPEISVDIYSPNSTNGFKSSSAKSPSKKGLWSAMSAFGCSTTSSVSLFGSGASRSRSGSLATKSRGSSKCTGGRRASQDGTSAEEQQSPPNFIHLQTIPLLPPSAGAKPADYKKRKYVIRLFPGPGGRRTILLRTQTEEEMLRWVEKLTAAVAATCKVAV